MRPQHAEQAKSTLWLEIGYTALKTLIMLSITYAMEKTTMTKRAEEDLKLIQRNIMIRRAILWPSITAEGETRATLKGEIIDRHIAAQKLK